jgi:lysophospholipid acyltransferase (LPLAT)-like uncharacterized protein
MKLRHPGLIGLVALLASWLIRFWIRTLRFRWVFLDGKKHPTDPRLDPHIYALWHEALLFPSALQSRTTILISQHADGELFARISKHLGGSVVRGSTTRGGMAALMDMAQTSRTHLAITPDGPRGPRRRLQIGAVLLASLTGLPLVPAGLTFAPAWKLSSWDRLLLPRPWGTAYGVMGTPIYVPPGLNRKALEQYRLSAEDQLRRLTDAVERWAHEGVRPAPAGGLPAKAVPAQTPVAPRAEKAAA